ncbi:MAG: gliding motility-associated C-terminal domain-containing protein, partial [Flavobacteriales bacterium]|nr:gliding motility-associated C-terminal domain-containing protein [Flavobacteriales bacterium]
ANGSLATCPTDLPTDLFLQLGGSPDIAGTWAPVLTSGTGVFDPTTDAAGTYTYTLTSSCGTSSNNVVVTITSCTVPTAGYTISDNVICENNCVNFTDQSSGATSWAWTFSAGIPSSSADQNPANICFISSGTYNIQQIVTNSNGSDTITSTILVNATPIVNAGTDVTVDLGDNITLNATGTNGSYTWSPPIWLSCVICVDPILTPTETITYTVTVVDSNGCSASDDVTVIVDFDYVIWIPNIFSPNGDGNNDVLYARGVGVDQLKFFVYDRWGEKVFETQDLNIGWDGVFRGKKMNNAVFVYYLEAIFHDGTEVSQKGDVTLIR